MVGLGMGFDEDQDPTPIEVEHKRRWMAGYGTPCPSSPHACADKRGVGVVLDSYPGRCARCRLLIYPGPPRHGPWRPAPAVVGHYSVKAMRRQGLAKMTGLGDG